MIDAERILELARQPARVGSDRQRDADRMTALAGAGKNHGTLSRPVAWSAARCTSWARSSEHAAAGVCAACPIRQDCLTVPAAGAPATVRAWRERMDEQ
ncbi:hypothetical protein [Streptomyces alanosinicus]|uniref:Uncharacterized protein n=1 Tax=Streptomyces alanosinicus TaxID=68171 RepID=A0A918YQ37_9ACTN|nr:hypothetical protein [Streptomyces alanosinicus]GHE11463.1 hypothetical protein GCM10010339_71430 [Streptomyces alanosinicus]